MKLGKKANMDDIGFAIKMWIAVGVIFVLTGFLFSQFNTQIQAHGGSYGFTNQSKAFFSEYNTNMDLSLDWSFALLIVGMISISLMLANKVQTSPVFLIFTIIYLIIIWAVAWVVAIFWDRFAVGSTQLTAYINSLHVIPFMLNHLVFIVLIYSFLLGITLYLKEQ